MSEFKVRTDPEYIDAILLWLTQPGQEEPDHNTAELIKELVKRIAELEAEVERKRMEIESAEAALREAAKAFVSDDRERLAEILTRGGARSKAYALALEHGKRIAELEAEVERLKDGREYSYAELEKLGFKSDIQGGPEDRLVAVAKIVRDRYYERPTRIKELEEALQGARKKLSEVRGHIVSDWQENAVQQAISILDDALEES
jgi:chromosome segregation ATPase